MRIPRKLQVVAGAVVPLILIVAVLPLLIDVNHFLPEIDAQLGTAFGRPVTLGHISLNLFEGGLVAKDLAVADDPAFSAQPFLQAKSLDISVDLMPLLFSKRLSVHKFEVVAPSIQLIQNPAGVWNFSTIGTTAANQATQKQTTPTAAPALSVDSLAISNARITVQTLPAPAVRVYDKVNIDVKNFSFTTQFPFSLSAELQGGGTARLTGTAGPINPVDNTKTPLTADLTITHLDPVAAGFLEPQSGIAGLLDITTHLASDGTTATLGGSLTGTQMRFAPKATPASTPVNVDFSTAYTLAALQGQLTKGTIKAGDISASLTGNYTLNPAGAEIHLGLSAPNMSIDALQTLLPAFGVVLPSGSGLKGGTLSASFKIDGPTGNLVIAGPVDLSNSELQGFSLMSKLGSLPLLNKLGSGNSSGTAIQSMHADIRMTNPQLETNNLSAVIPSIGQATGSGVILPSGALDYKMKASINALNGIASLGGLLGSSKSSGGIPLLIKGTTSSPSFSLDTGSLGLSKPSVPSADTVKQAGSKLKGLFGR